MDDRSGVDGDFATDVTYAQRNAKQLNAYNSFVYVSTTIE